MHESAYSEGPWEELCGKVGGLGDEIVGLRVAQQRRGDELEHGLESVHTDMERLDGRLSELSATLSQTRDAIAGVAATADATQHALNSFVERYGRDQIVANAQAELSRLTMDWTARFANRRQIRALARGLTHALTEDAVARRIVDSATIEACVQEKLLMDPSFWLAPAVVAVAADHNRDPIRAARARSHALILDQAKATLFFALTASRQKRQSEAARWMDQYLAALDPSDLGQEFTVVLEAVACAELGFEALTYARQAMTRWDREENARLFTLSHAESASAHLARWEPWMLERGVNASQRFDALQRLSGPQWEDTQQGWEAATAVKGTIEYLRGEYSARPADPKGGFRTDIALGHLIGQFDLDEIQMKEQMDRFRAIIDHKGDVSAAEAANARIDSIDKVDFLALLERAVFEPRSVDLGYSARLLATHSAWPSLRPAVVALAERSQSLLPERLTLEVDGWTCRLPIDLVGPEEGERLFRSLFQHLERRKEIAVSSIVPLWRRSFACLLAALACVGLALFLGGASGGLVNALAVLLLLCAILGVVHAPIRRHLLREEATRSQQQSMGDLKNALGQHALLFRQWHSGLSMAAQWNSWSPAAGSRPKPQSED